MHKFASYTKAQLHVEHVVNLSRIYALQYNAVVYRINVNIPQIVKTM